MNGIFRQLSIVLGILILVGAVVYSNKLAEQKEPPKQKEAAKESIPQVNILTVKNETITSAIPIQGRLEAFSKTPIFTEVQGILESSDKPFRVGTYFPKGSTLLRINQEETRLNLLAQRSSLMNAITMMMPDLKIDYPSSFQQWKTYLDQFDVKQSIRSFPQPLNEREKYFVANRNLLSQYYSIKSLENRLGKYAITAPFSGVLTQANVTVGSLVSPGQMLGTLMNTSNYELAATANLADLDYIEVGDRVSLTSDDVKGTWTGKVKRINNIVDPATQSVIVYIDINGKNLREGMYLRGEVAANSIRNVMELPIEIVNTDEQSVFVVKEDKLQKMEVNIQQERGNSVLVSGVPDGTQLLNSRVSNVYEGMTVEVNEDKSLSQKSLE